jgi:osmotically-inducible protein OsmY
MDAEEAVLHAAVMDALLDAGIDGVEAEIDRDSVTLHGHVADAAAIGYAEQVVDRVPGVRDIVNRLVVRT